MALEQQLISMLGEILSLPESYIASMNRETPLMGEIPEFDSMAVVSILTALEENFGFFVEDDEMNADIFETVNSLIEFIEDKT